MMMKINKPKTQTTYEIIHIEAEAVDDALTSAGDAVSKALKK